MSKWKQIRKTKLLKEKRNPLTRLQKITELKRNIKLYKADVNRRKKEVENIERGALWARLDYDNFLSQIEGMEENLADLEQYDKQEKEKTG